MSQVGHLIELQNKYYDKGLRIIAISAESSGVIQSKLIGDREANYWVASDPGRETLNRFSTPGGIGIPHAYLVDASGTIVGEGVPSDGRIEELLANVFDPKLDRALHPSLKSLVKLYEKGQAGKAWAGAARYTENENRKIVDDAQYLREQAEAWAAFQQKSIEGGIKAKTFGNVYDDLKAVQKDFAGMEVAKWAAAKKKALDADPAVKNEIKAWKSYLKAQKKERDAGGKKKKLGPASKAYKKIIKKYPGTRGAQAAEKAYVRLPG